MTTQVKARWLERPWIGTSMMVALLLGLIQYWRVQDMVHERLAALEQGTVDMLLWVALIIGPFAFLLAAMTSAVAISGVGKVMEEPWTFREAIAVGCIVELSRLIVPTIETWVDAIRFERTGALASTAIADLSMLELMAQCMLRPSSLVFTLALAFLAWRGLGWTRLSALTLALLMMLVRSAVTAFRMADPILRS